MKGVCPGASVLEVEQNLKDLVDGQDLLKELAALLDSVVFNGKPSSQDVLTASERMTRALFDAVVDESDETCCYDDAEG